MSDKSLFYIGTYTEPILHGTGHILEGKGEGIYLLSLDRNSGKIENIGLVASARNPSFLCLSPDRRFLYSVNELKQYEGKEEGAVSAFAVEEGGLRLLNQKPTGGTDPCHVATSHCGRFLMVSNFMSGSVRLFYLAEDGSLSDEGQFIQHTGSSVDPVRQKGPHAHSATFDKNDEWIYVPDLGIDQVKIYSLDKKLKKLTEADSYKAVPGYGPRFCEAGPGSSFLYCINELTCSVSVFKCGQGSLSELETQLMLPGGKKDGSIAAKLHITPNGRFLYASQRGEDCLVWFEILSDGKLAWRGSVSSGGKVPRDFILDQSGEFLLAANQNSDVVVAFRICPETGSLEETDRCVIHTPVCVCRINR